MPNVVRRGHVNNAPQGTTVTIVASEAAAGAIDEALDEALEPINEQLADLTEQVGAASASVQSLSVELPLGRRSGSLLVEPEGGFSDTQVGAPVLVTIAPNQGAIETVLFAGEVLNSRQMRLHWSAPGPAPSRVIVNYIIGSRQEE